MSRTVGLGCISLEVSRRMGTRTARAALNLFISSQDAVLRGFPVTEFLISFDNQLLLTAIERITGAGGEDSGGKVAVA